MFLVHKVSMPYIIHKPSTMFEKLTFQYSFHINAKESQSNLFLQEKQRSTWGHYLKNVEGHLCFTQNFQGFFVSWFWGRLTKVFTIYGQGGLLDQRTITI